MSEPMITLHRDFVRGLISLGVSVTSITNLEPKFLHLIDKVAPTDEQLEELLAQAEVDFGE